MTRVFSLMRESLDRLEVARAGGDGRSAVSLHEGEPCVLRQTVTALLAGRHMDVEHPPDEAWILVLEGQVRVREHGDGPQAGDTDGVGARAGALVQLPRRAMSISADIDSVVLLTVAKGERPLPPVQEEERNDIRRHGSP